MINLIEFEDQDVEIITNENGNPLFELYSTGMALGQVKTAKGKRQKAKGMLIKIELIKTSKTLI